MALNSMYSYLDQSVCILLKTRHPTTPFLLQRNTFEFGIPQRKIHILQRLRSCSLQEIINRHNNHLNDMPVSNPIPLIFRLVIPKPGMRPCIISEGNVLGHSSSRQRRYVEYKAKQRKEATHNSVIIAFNGKTPYFNPMRATDILHAGWLPHNLH